MIQNDCSYNQLKAELLIKAKIDLVLCERKNRSNIALYCDDYCEKIVRTGHSFKCIII